MDAARGNHVTVLQYLLDEYKASLELSDVLGRCGLHHAAQAGAGEAIECLVARGADVNQAVSVNSITPLHYAAKVTVRAYICLHIIHSQTSQLSLFWCETQASGPNLTLSLQTHLISVKSHTSHSDCPGLKLYINWLYSYCTCCSL